MTVALLAEGVDRNCKTTMHTFELHVALLAEGVDRNDMAAVLGAAVPVSPSSRRAWIEIGR